MPVMLASVGPVAGVRVYGASIYVPPDVHDTVASPLVGRDE
jgi:hypothetical protein